MLCSASVDTTKWTGLLARTCAFIFYILIEYLITGPKSYQGFRETVPSIVNVTIQANFRRICMESSEHNGASISSLIFPQADFWQRGLISPCSF